MIKSFDPVFDNNCKILILGSCPSIKSLEQGEYYAHKQNRFWHIMFKLLGCEYTMDTRLLQNGRNIYLQGAVDALFSYDDLCSLLNAVPAGDRKSVV